MIVRLNMNVGVCYVTMILLSHKVLLLPPSFTLSVDDEGLVCDAVRSRVKYNLDTDGDFFCDGL